jgi:parvulin-like peptidyl-prolyl isomerase
MRRLSGTWIVAIMLLLGARAPAEGADELPVVKGKRVVATVGRDVISEDDLRAQAGPPSAADPAAARAAQLAVLDRMINVALIAQEARRIGLDKLPEVRKVVDANARIALREELVARTLRDVKADPKAVDEAYRESVREWKLTAVLFPNEADARALAGEVAAGKALPDVAETYRAAGKATKIEPGVLVKRQAMDPAVAAVVAKLAVGGTSPPIRTAAGFIVVRLDDVHYPDDPAARRAAEEKILVKRRQETVGALDEALTKKYAKVNAELLKSLDYDAPQPGIEALAKDRRVLAEIKGEPPITVAELTEELKFQFFHGTKAAAERGQLNARKQRVFDTVLHRKLFRKEALRLGLDKTDAYRRRVKAFEESVLFDAVVRKAIAPSVKMSADDVKAYYDAHRAEYTTPEMMRIRAVAFVDVKSAERARDALAKGADVQWVMDRAEGQLPADTAGRLVFDGRPVLTSALPDGVQQAVAGAKSGDLRLYVSPEKHGYLLVVDQVIAASPRPFDEVKADITKIVAGRKIEEAVAEYAAKLRPLSDVKVYLRAF